MVGGGGLELEGSDVLHPEWKTWRTLGLPIVAVGVSFLAKCLSEPWLSFSTPLLFFYPAVVVSLFWGGAWAGAWATLLSITAGGYLLGQSDERMDAGEAIRLGVLLWGSAAACLLYHRAQRVARERSERAVRAAEARGAAEVEALRLAMESAIEGIARLDGAGVCISANGAFRAMLGRGPAEVEGRAWGELVHAEDRALAEAAWGASAGGTKAEVEARMPRGDGGIAHVRMTLVALGEEVGGGRYCFAKDVTARREAEARVRLSEAKFRTVTECSPLGIFLASADGRCAYVNAVWSRLTGLDESSSAGEGWLEGLHREERERVGRAWASAVGAGRRFELETRLRAAEDGSVRWAHVCAVPYHDSGGAVAGWVGTVEDVSDRMRAAAEADEARGRLAAVLEHAPIPVFMKDLSGRYLVVNPRAAAVLGRPAEAVVGRTDRELFAAAVAERLMADDRRALRHRGALEVEELVPTAGGEPRTYLSVKFPLFDADGSPYAVCGLATDITALKRVEAELRESRERFAGVFRDSAIGIAIVGLDGRWLEVNAALCGLLGYGQRELLASDFQALTHPEDLAKDLEHVRRLLAGEGSSYQMVKRYLHKGGAVIRALLSVSLVRDPAGRPMYFVSQVQAIADAQRAAEGGRVELCVGGERVEGGEMRRSRSAGEPVGAGVRG